MFDEYQPRHQLVCPVCRLPVEGWQGKQGLNVRVRWLEGGRWPVETVEEQGRDKEFMTRFSLPAEFEIIRSAIRVMQWSRDVGAATESGRRPWLTAPRSAEETARLKSRPFR